jgi:hypothetical protein
MPEEKLCRDYADRPGCLRVADERYTMDFSDIGKPPIYWCSRCGPEAHAVDAAIDKAIKERPGFAKEFEEAIEDASWPRKVDKLL